MKVTLLISGLIFGISLFLLPYGKQITCLLCLLLSITVFNYIIYIIHDYLSTIFVIICLLYLLLSPIICGSHSELALWLFGFSQL